MNQKVETVKQFKCLEWIKNNFFVNDVKLTLIDDSSIKITDKNEQEAYIYCDDADEIHFTDDLYILASIKEEYIILKASDLDKVAEANGYIVPDIIKAYASEKEAEIVLKQNIAEQELEDIELEI